MGFFQRLKERLFSLEPVVPKKDQPKVAQVAVAIDESKKDKQTKAKKLTPDGTESPSASMQADEKVRRDLFKRRQKAKAVDKYVAGLSKTSASFVRSLHELQSRHHELDEEFFEALTETLMLADIPPRIVMEIVEETKREVRLEKVKDSALVQEVVVDKLFTFYTNHSVVDVGLNLTDEGMNVILVSGVNGVGKTTTIAKLAYMLKNQGYKVSIIAGDTFRAGAVEQLGIWAERIGVEITKPLHPNADPGSVVFAGLDAAINAGMDIVIIDTAGRLQNKKHLMEELGKINRIINNKVPGAPQESLLVIDATLGQNGLMQAKIFKELMPLTGIVLTKMDGTARGGIIIGIKNELGLPVKMIGLGEQLDDLQEFDFDAFIYALTKDLFSAQNEPQKS